MPTLISIAQAVGFFVIVSAIVIAIAAVLTEFGDFVSLLRNARKEKLAQKRVELLSEELLEKQARIEELEVLIAGKQLPYR